MAKSGPYIFFDKIAKQPRFFFGKRHDQTSKPHADYLAPQPLLSGQNSDTIALNLSLYGLPARQISPMVVLVFGIGVTGPKLWAVVLIQALILGRMIKAGCTLPSTTQQKMMLISPGVDVVMEAPKKGFSHN